MDNMSDYVKRPHFSSPSCDSTKSHENGGELREDPDRPVSPVPSYLSMKTDRSKDIPLNFKHGDLTQEKGMQPEEVFCDVCDDKAMTFCQTCSLSYCQTHVKKHYTLPKLQTHTLVKLTGGLEDGFCQEHQRPMEVFCRTDQMLICSLCSGTTHKEHDTKYDELKIPGIQSKIFDGDQTPTSNNELSSPEKFQVMLLTSDSVSLSWSSPQGVEGPQTFRVTWECSCEKMSSRVKGGNHLEISSLNPGEKYLFTVATEGDDGRLSRCISTTLTTVVPPRDLKVDDLDNTSFTLHWTKAEGMEKVPQRFLITYCIPGPHPEHRAVNTENCYRTFSNLQPGTEYIVSLVTVLNTEEESGPVSVTIWTLVPAPDQLTVDSVDTTSATVIWKQPPGLEQTHHHYQISYQCPGTEPHITTTSSPSITLSDLKPATEYSVTVCTLLDNGKESQMVLTTLNTMLPAPDQLTVDSVDTTSATVIWNQPPGLDQTHHHYQISYQCPGTEPHITTTSSPSITLSDVKPATEYTVTVCTVMDDGIKSQVVTTTLTTSLPAPDQLTVDSVDTTSATVIWNQPPGLDQTHHHYQISYQCPGTEPHITTTSSSSITLSDLKPVTQYSVTVCTVMDDGMKSQLVSTTLITNLFHERDQCQKKAEDFTKLCLKPAVLDYVTKMIGPDVVDEVKTGEGSEDYSTRMSFQFSILKQLLTDGKYEKYKEYIRNYEQFVNKWLFDHIVIQLSKESSLEKLEMKHLTEMVKIITDAIVKVRNTTSTNKDIKTFIQNLCSALGDKLVLPKDALDSIMTLYYSEKTDQFADSLTEFVEEMEQTLEVQYIHETDVTKRLRSLPFKPQDKMFTSLFGCGEVCPFCKSPCEAGGKEHSKHFTSVHRPQGVSGWRNRETKVLLSNICSSSVISDLKFKIPLNKDQYHPFKDYQKYYPKWIIAGDSSIEASDYWKYVMVTFNERIAEDCNALPADIPEDWKALTPEDAMKSLKGSFNVKD
ncbi:hypothetical protein UPYG_G00047180 [Umbra pygmaea]|uniref:Uncharacterized protein n=1 Tax=Umbra pygmaea TaxID=75934 RepID=A0ABD0XSS5_UMBPY